MIVIAVQEQGWSAVTVRGCCTQCACNLLPYLQILCSSRHGSAHHVEKPTQSVCLCLRVRHCWNALHELTLPSIQLLQRQT